MTVENNIWHLDLDKHKMYEDIVLDYKNKVNKLELEVLHIKRVILHHIPELGI